MNGNQPIKSFEDFWQDTLDCWRRLPNKAFFFVLLAAWLALFQFLGNSILGYIHTTSLFSWMSAAYNSGNPGADDGIGDFIPFLVVGLFWWKRHELLESRLRVWGLGLVILMLAMILHIVAYVVEEPHFSIVAMFIGVYGIMGMAWGPQWLKKSFFPFFLFIFSIPLGAHGQIITFPLRLFVCRLVELVTHFFGIDVIRAGTQLFDPSGSFQYDVAPACSGIRSLVSFFLLSTVYGFFTFNSSWKRFLLMLLGFPFAILGNLLRLLMVVIVAEFGGQKWGDFVHDNWFTSIVPYLPAFFGLLLLGHWLEKCPDKFTDFVADALATVRNMPKKRELKPE